MVVLSMFYPIMVLPTNKHTLRHVIKRHSNLANVHHIKIHALRHSHASLLISLGINALDVRDRLGHEDIETTLGTYGHLYPPPIEKSQIN